MHFAGGEDHGQSLSLASRLLPYIIVGCYFSDIFEELLYRNSCALCGRVSYSVSSHSIWMNQNPHFFESCNHRSGGGGAFHMEGGGGEKWRGKSVSHGGGRAFHMEGGGERSGGGRAFHMEGGRSGGGRAFHREGGINMDKYINDLRLYQSTAMFFLQYDVCQLQVDTL